MNKQTNNKNRISKRKKIRSKKKKKNYKLYLAVNDFTIEKKKFNKFINKIKEPLKFHLFGNTSNINSRENMLVKLHKSISIYILTANPLYKEIEIFLKILNWNKYFKNVLFCDVHKTTKYNIIKSILLDNNHNVYNNKKIALLVDDSELNMAKDTKRINEQIFNDYSPVINVIDDYLIKPSVERSVGMDQNNSILLKSGLNPYNNKLFGMDKNDCNNIVNKVKNNNIKFLFIDWDNTFQIYNGMFRIKTLFNNLENSLDLIQ